MPATSRSSLLLINVTPNAHARALIISRCRHRLISVTSNSRRESQFRRSDFQGQGYTAPYEPGQPTSGPLGEASNHGAPRLTPLLLKAHLDKFVVGQEKAKKVTSVAIFNHYQRVRELQRLEAEEQERREQKVRRQLHERERHSHPVENEFPGHVETVDLNASIFEEEPEIGSRPLDDNSPTVIEKSNLMLLGPSGVGKTYILQTLAKVLEVPFATVDCSSLTQAGYIGTDVESSLERLLLASSYNLSKCETGIIFFDEVDKLAKPAVMTHGRDVSGEGVQQGLLKIIEGTTVTVNAKADKSSASTTNVRGGGNKEAAGKVDQYTIDTSNILFVFAGAFIGLEKIITSRLTTSSSLGFGSSLSTASNQDPVEKNTLAYVTPADLQTYGIIPEMLGRIPVLTSLSPLTLPQLVSILTEPRNSLVKQYTALFATYNIQLRFTHLALEAIAARAISAPLPGQAGTKTSELKKGNGLGARGLRSIMENVLGEVMFWGPGSAVRFVLIDQAFVEGLETQPKEDGHVEVGEDNVKMPRVWSRGQAHLFTSAFEEEEEAWKASRRSSAGKDNETAEEKQEHGSFEQMRSVGSSGM
ncbi:p-loop containing nucleoside triphosphate hydrolase-29 [Coleophoma crateriformis]|uniref:p-loop containing nucleoside triphosphate hydrolase-29 n=1 Tax=Coleophoma crateriformis TaxID=565419 RepID=A0A3D8T9U1_9HELO|nr:p-loop containing nucleoside triphosphate hydrolase-29 [Coleophoma crateriformis]